MADPDDSSTAVADRPVNSGPGFAERDVPWSCYFHIEGGAKKNLSREDIQHALESKKGTLWVDVDYRNPQQTALLSEVFHFHPLAIEDALNPHSRVSFEEYRGLQIEAHDEINIIRHPGLAIRNGCHGPRDHVLDARRV